MVRGQLIICLVNGVLTYIGLAMLGVKFSLLLSLVAAALAARRDAAADVDAVVAPILEDVRTRGDAALIDCTRRFDDLALTPETLRIGATEIDAAMNACDATARKALDLAARRIVDFHSYQRPDA